MQATIYKYHREEKRIKLYQCTYFLTTNMCKEEFFATKYTTVSIHEEKSHVTDCQRAVRNKRSPHNHLLVKRSGNTWETSSHNTFKCSWLEVNSLKYFGYRITLHEAVVRSGDRLIHQNVTATECLIQQSSCRPMEDTLQILIYKAPKLVHNYRNLRKHKILITHGMGSTSSIGMGGAVVQRSNEAIELNSGFILKLDKLKKIEEVKLYQHALKQDRATKLSE